MGNAIANVKEPPKSVALVQYFEERQADFGKLMPTSDIDRFMRTMKNAIIRDPLIAEASKQSVYLEISKAAADGLVLDGREAVLTRFKTNKRQKNPKTGNWEDNWITEVVYIPMIRGLRKLVMLSPQISSWHVDLVYEEEYKAGRFTYHSGDSPSLTHEPIIVGERGPVVAAYSVARLRDGHVSIEVMTRGQLDKIKGRTKSKKPKKVGNNEITEITGPWASDEEEMQKKTVARRHFKHLPLSDKAAEAAERIDGLYSSFDPGDDEHEEIAIAEQPAAVRNKKQGSAADKLKAARPKPGPDDEGDPSGGNDDKVIDHDGDFDKETGEILDDSWRGQVEDSGEAVFVEGGQRQAKDEF